MPKERYSRGLQKDHIPRHHRNRKCNNPSSRILEPDRCRFHHRYRHRHRSCKHQGLRNLHTGSCHHPKKRCHQSCRLRGRCIRHKSSSRHRRWLLERSCLLQRLCNRSIRNRHLAASPRHRSYPRWGPYNPHKRCNRTPHHRLLPLGCSCRHLALSSPQFHRGYTPGHRQYRANSRHCSRHWKTQDKRRFRRRYWRLHQSCRPPHRYNRGRHNFRRRYWPQHRNWKQQHPSNPGKYNWNLNWPAGHSCPPLGLYTR